MTQQFCYQKTCTQIVRTALFIIAQTLKLPQCLGIELEMVTEYSRRSLWQESRQEMVVTAAVGKVGAPHGARIHMTQRRMRSRK